MDKVIELAREAGLMFCVLPEDYCRAVELPVGHIGSIGDVTIHQIEKFYSLARAELEAENAKLRVMYDRVSDAAKDLGNIRDHLEAENEQLRKERQAFKDVAEYQKAENAKLRKELDYFYMYMPTDVKKIVRAALGEKND